MGYRLCDRYRRDVDKTIYFVVYKAVKFLSVLFSQLINNILETRQLGSVMKLLRKVFTERTEATVKLIIQLPKKI